MALCIKKKYKKSLKINLLKVTKFHGDSVKNKSAKTKKTRGRGGSNVPPPSCLGFSNINKIS